MKFVLLFTLVLISQNLFAGYYELGFTGNYRKIYLPTDNTRESFDESLSYTASFAYYFAEMAAAELNYTKGKSERFVPSATADSRTTYDYGLVGLDLIFTFAERKAPFVPYIKGGVAYFAQKNVTYEFIDNLLNSTQSETVKLDPTFVPSLGFGLKIRVTATMAFKVGLESWTSDSLSSDPKWDWAARAGISWFL